MPGVVGQNLQAAQDAVQELTGFAVRVTTHDLSGADRRQVTDVEWMVCTQTPEAGTEITTDSMVDLGVVRQDEDC
ncbi:PASTA domain-containing protein [Pseudonocardia petroleophila]|uniref:PASTA domain-containing protein n=2 Tax=Pseudonocardia petroleophila TaxID=37331 RepID=A0A7G7MR47_9PSEU|nr:PASTA domain-containing protein [Pseudonocardia petroleophila]